MHRKLNSDHFTFLKFENPSSVSKVRWQFWQQLCYQVAAVAAALVAVWLLGSSSMNWKFNSDHSTFLKFENPSSCSKVRQQFCYQVSVVIAAWLLGSSSMLWKFNFNYFTFLKFENPSSGAKVRWHFWQQLCSQVLAVAAALVAAWLLGSSSMQRKFNFVAAWLLDSSSMQREINSDHFTFLKFENPSSGSEVMTYVCYDDIVEVKLSY